MTKDEWLKNQIWNDGYAKGLEESGAIKIQAESENWEERCIELENALKAIRIWASCENGIGLVPEHVIKLCDKTLNINSNE